MGEGRELFAIRKDGTEFPVEISLSHYHAKGNLFVFAFVIDITMRKENEASILQQKKELEAITAEMKQMNMQLEQKIEERTRMLRETLAELERSKTELKAALEAEKHLSELKSRFVTTASHEFRTPLSTILSSAFLLEKYNNDGGPEKREKHIRRIKDAVTGMRNILEDFLSLGKLEEGSIITKMQTIGADDCFEDIQQTIQDVKCILKHGQKIKIYKKGNNPVDIDRNLLKNILINLLSNAIKFSPENAIIDVRGNISSYGIRVSVQDKGIGISEEDQRHLFERFFRAKNATNIQGTGLGLHIAGRYLELMNGSIELESRINEGTTFTIYIPGKTMPGQDLQV